MTNGKIPAEINRAADGEVAGVVRLLDKSSSQLEKELITVGTTIEAAIGRAVIKDERQRNKIIRYLGRLQRCHLTEEMDLLRIWINASFAIGGHQRDESLMAKATLWVPEGGRKMDRKQMDKFIEAQAMKNSNNNRDRGNGEHDNG